MGKEGTGAVLRISRRANGEPEIFHSLQGEGPAMGTPSVFVRLALCNLACTWCDTKYTWDWSNYDYKNEVMELSCEQVADFVLRYECRHVVLTGGEPLLQQVGLASLVRSLKAREFSFEVETNGTIAPIPQLVRYIDEWNVSPKLANSGNPLQHREVAQVVGSFARLPNAYFKFVVAERADLGEIAELVSKYGIPRERVLLMPEGRTAATLQRREPWLSRVWIEQGFRYTPRLHILLWGDRRGT